VCHARAESAGWPERNQLFRIERIASRIYVIRGEKVMLDSDLAELYGVQTKVLLQAVKRNIDRFPDDFLFQFSKQELENWRSQIVTSNPTAKIANCDPKQEKRTITFWKVQWKSISRKLMTPFWPCFI
jgi:hypothetical protein